MTRKSETNTELSKSLGREEVGYKETPAFKNSRKKQPVEIIFKGEIIKLSHFVLRCFGFLILRIY